MWRFKHVAVTTDVMLSGLKFSLGFHYADTLSFLLAYAVATSSPALLRDFILESLYQFHSLCHAVHVGHFQTRAC